MHYYEAGQCMRDARKSHCSALHTSIELQCSAACTTLRAAPALRSRLARSMRWGAQGPAPHLALGAVAGHAAAAALRARLHLLRAGLLLAGRARRRTHRRTRRRRGGGKGLVHGGQAGGVVGAAGRRDAGQRGLRARGLRRRRAPARPSYKVYGLSSGVTA